MRGVEECLTAGGPWSLEEIENVTGYASMKDFQLGEQQAEIEELKIVAGVRLAGMTAVQAENERLTARLATVQKQADADEQD